MEETIKIDTEEDIYREDEVAKAAFENFGIKYLFPWQRMVISNILEAYEYHKQISNFSQEEKKRFDAENADSFCKGRQIVLLPTGAGKSLCFQVPALLFDGPSLIVYPLLALMTDQQRRMEEGSLRSVTFRGGQSAEERNSNFEKIKNGAKIILANPEVLQNEELLEQLKQVGILHIAIDEAHCVSEWGDSFRPSYLELGRVIEVINPSVITAFTATASPSVLSRISEILFKGEAHVVRSESDRQNIHYFVRYAASKKKEALFLAETEMRPMIIFCGTRRNSEDMAQELNLCFGQGTARFYHAGLEKSEKEETEKWFYESKNGILAATCAYGMGIDKKDIKTVIHLSPPATAEAYIQEAGRGGRDGSVAKAILIWSLGDSLDYSVYKENSREAAMRIFAETEACRRQVLLDALGGEQVVCSGCDLCNERDFLRKIESEPEKSRKRLLKNHNQAKQKSDWQIAFEIVAKTPNFYTKEDLDSCITEKMNRRFQNLFGKAVWNHSDSMEVIKQLENSNRIVKDNFWWKGCYRIVRSNP